MIAGYVRLAATDCRFGEVGNDREDFFNGPRFVSDLA